jgi:hypothetical protein
VQIIFGNGGASCILQYNAPSTVYINRDSGTIGAASGAVGGLGTIENSQCRLDLAGSSAAGSANNLTLNLAVTFKSGLQGQQNIYMSVGDNAGLASAWQQMGAWTIPAHQPPVSVSVSPASGTGTTQVFTFTAASANGYRNIAYEQIIFENGGASCFLFYVSSGTVYVNSDSGIGWAGSGALGESRTIESSQCSLDLAASSATGSSNNLTLRLAITFKSGLRGQQNIYMVVVDNAGLVSGWQQLGTWTIPPPQPPVSVSVSPSSGTGTTQVFIFTASSGGGYRNIAYVQIIFGNGGASCFLDYVSSGTVYLNNDSGTGWAASGALGESRTIENSQCRLNLAASSATGNSNNLTLSLAVTFKSGLQGQQNIYMAVVDNAGLASAWRQMGTWTP